MRPQYVGAILAMAVLSAHAAPTLEAELVDRAGPGPAVAASWKRGGTNPGKGADWKRSGSNPGKGAEWKRAGGVPPSGAQWKRGGSNPPSGAQWKRAGAGEPLKGSDNKREHPWLKPRVEDLD